MKNVRNLSLSLLITIVSMVIIVILFHAINQEKSPSLHRIIILLGGDIKNGGYIQGLTYFAFIWSWFEVHEKLREIHRERRAFNLGLLPSQDKNVFLPQDINNLKFKMIEYERREKYVLTDLIKKACTKFRSTGSMSELIDIVSIQVEVSQEKAESSQSMIRYLTWVIPSIGFVGTVLGISQALVVANSGDMNLITTLLGVAFDTTLVALILSIVIMYYVHQLQEETDKFHSDLKDFVVENLINKIELI